MQAAIVGGLCAHRIDEIERSSEWRCNGADRGAAGAEDVGRWDSRRRLGVVVLVKGPSPKGKRRGSTKWRQGSGTGSGPRTKGENWRRGQDVPVEISRLCDQGRVRCEIRRRAGQYSACLNSPNLVLRDCAQVVSEGG